MTRSDPYEELASLFLTDADHVNGGGHAGVELVDPPDVPRRGHGSPAATVEVALVGHLPVMGGLWLTQYADQIGRTDGPVALVRLERGQVSIELLRAPGQRGGLEAIDTLDQSLHFLAGLVRRWIVCPQGEAALDGPFTGDALSLLTGGDDAATVAAYRIIKSLAERWHHAGWPVPPIGLVVLGATDERAAEVVEKLDRTTKAFLDVDLTVAALHQRMDAIESAGRRAFAGIECSVDEICRRIRLIGSRVQREPTATTQSTSATSPRAPARAVPRLGPKGLRTEAPQRLVEPAPAGRGQVEPIRAGAVGRPLSGGIPGLEALPVRCPSVPAVELAVDANGALHLVASVTAIGALRAVEAWALAHADLLRLACPRLLTLDRIESHVVTGDAPAVVPLHGTGLRLHLLLETAHGVVHAPLN